MQSHTRTRFFTCILLALCCLCGASGLRAQAVDSMDEVADDPGQLFQRAQAAQARNQLDRALALYDEALKLRPEYPEAEYQKGVALTGLNRLPEAERALRRAAELRTEWALPQTALGLLFTQQKRDKEAEPFLRRALELDPEDQTTLIAYAQLWLRAGDKAAALALYKRATSDESGEADTWAARGTLERLVGDDKAALISLRHALLLDPKNIIAREERAELSATANDYARAAEDLQFLIAEQKQSPRVTLWQQRLTELRALATRQAAGLPDNGPTTTAAVPAATVDAANNADPAVARPALRALLQTDPKNAVAHARLCAIDRANDPANALAHCRTALELDPRNADYATGYAAALVQARRFADAVPVLRQVLALAPDTYAAHANLATALDELKQYDAALVEYQWVNRAKPELAVVYFFIGRDLDLIGEFAPALAAYEIFLARADAQENKVEIERVNLRLPSLRNQIAHGEKRRKPRN